MHHFLLIVNSYNNDKKLFVIKECDVEVHKLFLHMIIVFKYSIK